MDFVAVVDQVIALLRQRGRVTYRTLQRQFQLDEDALADLLAELRYAHCAEILEEAQGVVGTGDTGAPPALSPAPPSAPLSDLQPMPTAPGARPAAERAAPEAERRQLTVMFCDLVDSTRLTGQLDPEDWREVVRAYQQTGAEVVQRFDGHVVQLLGDGLLVYFGWPQAHEDDALRAVRTGLGLLAAMAPLNTRLERDKGLRLAIRVGIHTGVVVVGAMGGAGRQ